MKPDLDIGRACKLLVEYGYDDEAALLRGGESEARVAVLEKALRDVIAENCCGCSVYANIAREALGLSDSEFEALKNANPRD